MFWSRGNSVPYIALAERESNSSSESEKFLGNGQEKEHGFEDGKSESDKRKNKLTSVLTAIAIVLSIVNITFFIHQYIDRGSATSTTSDSELELANAYIGFDKLHVLNPEAATPSYTIENMPLVVGSVDQELSNAVRPDETPHWWTFQGTVVPDRRHIFVNESISTIIQFRAQDYGLETCEPTLILPTFTDLIDANSTVKSENNKPRTYTVSDAPFAVHVWALDSVAPNGRELELDIARLTHANKPTRKTYLGALDAQEGVRATADAFKCKSGSLHTLELSCDSPGCLLDFWTDEVEPRMAFFIKQSAN